eukprot:1242930-Pleurochrysis_carterae.AAC.3
MRTVSLSCQKASTACTAHTAKQRLSLGLNAPKTTLLSCFARGAVSDSAVVLTVRSTAVLTQLSSRSA